MEYAIELQKNIKLRLVNHLLCEFFELAKAAVGTFRYDKNVKKSLSKRNYKSQR